MYRGKFDMGWDKVREAIFERQLAMKLIPAGTRLTRRIPEIPAWDGLTPEQKKLYARQMEVFAGMLTQTDEQIGRLISALKRIGQYDKTLIILTSDNGASGEGGLNGTFNESRVLNSMQTSLDENMKHYAGWASRVAKQFIRSFGDRKVYTYHWPGAQRIPEAVSAPIKNTSHTIETSVDLKGNEEGVIVACGGLNGGYTLFIAYTTREHFPFTGELDRVTITLNEALVPIPEIPLGVE
jgi:arylsulfatase A-like enzyme